MKIEIHYHNNSTGRQGTYVEVVPKKYERGGDEVIDAWVETTYGGRGVRRILSWKKI